MNCKRVNGKDLNKQLKDEFLGGLTKNEEVVFNFAFGISTKR